MSGFANRPKVLKGALVEYGLTVPPLIVVFQFNPVQLQRSRSLDFRTKDEVMTWPAPGRPGEPGETWRVERPRGLREWHAHCKDLDEIRDNQIVSVQEETLEFELRLDAGDALETGNPIAQGFGIGPALSALELMTFPKEESVLGQALGSLLGGGTGFKAPKAPNPPMVLFVWGLQRVLPVNINGLTVTETEFDTLLNPVRASVAVNLTVIEGGEPFFKFSKTAKEVMAVLNTANLVTDIVIPG
ncbi:hypothetical protein [Thermomonospora amylolytica]|uniref:hypothetical protein n=1 Tax=Thermomonospora amylolytica TaxID=1411117 RepID=UPI001300A1E5|nr:hypothetical protein [Thermomonospora amylolytica]